MKIGDLVWMEDKEAVFRIKNIESGLVSNAAEGVIVHLSDGELYGSAQRCRVLDSSLGKVVSEQSRQKLLQEAYDHEEKFSCEAILALGGEITQRKAQQEVDRLSLLVRKIYGRVDSVQSYIAQLQGKTLNSDDLELMRVMRADLLKAGNVLGKYYDSEAR